MNEKFWAFAKEQINVETWESLHHILGVSKYRLNSLINGTADFYPTEIGPMAKVLGLKPIELIMQYGVGRKYMTLDLMDELAKEEGLEVGLLAHSA